MKMKRILSAVLSAAVLATGVPAIVGTLQAGAANPAANLLDNGDFETETGFESQNVKNRLPGFDGLIGDPVTNQAKLVKWTRQGDGNETINSKIVEDPDQVGNHYLSSSQTLLQGVEEFANGKTYELSFRAKTMYKAPKDTTVLIGIGQSAVQSPWVANAMTEKTATSSAGDVWTDTIADGIRVTVGQTWTNVKVQFTLQNLEDDKLYILKFLDDSGNDVMAIDDMVLTEVGGEEPTEPTVAIKNGDFETPTGWDDSGIPNRIPGWAGLADNIEANYAKLTNWMRITGGNDKIHAAIVEDPDKEGNHFVKSAQTLLQGIPGLENGVTYRLTFKAKAFQGAESNRQLGVGIMNIKADAYLKVLSDVTITTAAAGNKIMAGDGTARMPITSDWNTYTVEFKLNGLEDGELYAIKFWDAQYVGNEEIVPYMALDDVSIEKVEVAEKADVALETGKDDGTIKDNGDGSFTAIPYAGNSFDGWYNGDTKVSGDATATLAPGATYVAKFASNNLIESPGYELYGHNESLTASEGWNIGSGWIGWGKVQATSLQKFSGKMSAQFVARHQSDLYRELTVEPNTDYTVSYKWLMPATYAQNQSTMMGMVIAPATAADWYSALDVALNTEGYDAEDKGTHSTGEWANQEFSFNSGNNTKVRIFLKFGAELTDPYNTEAHVSLYLDEFTIYEKGVVVEKKTVNVSADENGTAYIAKTDYEVGEKATVTAKPNINYVFEGWYDGSTKVSDQQTYTFTVEKSIDLVAKFVRGPIKYDVSQDGRFDETDIEQVQSYLIGAASLSESSLEIADVTGEGKVTVSDVVKLKRLLEAKENGMTKEQTKEALLAGTYDKFLDASVANKGNQARLANVLKKAQAGEKITIGFIGGSITEGAGVTAEQDRYVNQVFDWWTTNFPQATFELVNAGIGATSSLVGVSRVETDLLSKDPDFVVVDFTTNDDSTNNQFRETYENLVRRILEHDTEPAVMMIMFGAVDNAQYQQGKYVRKPNSAANHMATGLFYDVPVIDYNEALWQYLGDEIEWTDVAADYIHPNAAGHRMAAACIKSYLDAALTKLDVLDTKVPALPTDYFYGDRYMKAEMVVPTAVQNEGFTKAKVFQWENAWVSGAEGGKMTFTIENAKAVTFLYRMDGAAKITVNDKVINIADANNPNVAWPTETIFFDNATTLQVSVEAPADFALVRVLVNK